MIGGTEESGRSLLVPEYPRGYKIFPLSRTPFCAREQQLPYLEMGLSFQPSVGIMLVAFLGAGKEVSFTTRLAWAGWVSLLSTEQPRD